MEAANRPTIAEWEGVLGAMFAPWSQLFAGWSSGSATSAGAAANDAPLQALVTAGGDALGHFFQAASGSLAQSDHGSQRLEGSPDSNGSAALAAWQALAAQWLTSLLPNGAHETFVTAGTTLGNPLLEGLERTFGAVFDALGLGPPRELQRAFAGLVSSGAERERAKVAFLLHLNAAWPAINQTALRRLDALVRNGRAPQRFLDLTRLWATAAEDGFNEAMHSERGLALTAEYVRAASRYRQRFNRIVELASEMANVPTRAEVDEAYREIQVLKRELRRMRNEREQRAPVAARRRSARSRKESS